MSRVIHRVLLFMNWKRRFEFSTTTNFSTSGHVWYNLLKGFETQSWPEHRLSVLPYTLWGHFDTLNGVAQIHAQILMDLGRATILSALFARKTIQNSLESKQICLNPPQICSPQHSIWHGCWLNNSFQLLTEVRHRGLSCRRVHSPFEEVGAITPKKHCMKFNTIWLTCKFDFQREASGLCSPLYWRRCLRDNI